MPRRMAITAAALSSLLLSCVPVRDGQPIADLGRLRAHAVVESGSRDGSTFNEWAIHDSTTRQTYHPASHDEAVAIVERLAGHSIDAGLMQINSANWERLGLTVDTALRACPNIRAAAQIWSEDYHRVVQMVACGYNTGHLDCSTAAGVRYARMVDAAEQKLPPQEESPPAADDPCPMGKDDDGWHGSLTPSKCQNVDGDGGWHGSLDQERK
jgi:Zn ribbon nucleic-acid-binding protein